jgi:hypothetical protein
MTGDENDRDLDFSFGKLCLKIQPTHSGKPYVENQAARTVWPLGREEFGRRREGFDPQTDRPD